ncbi:hypothetical protein [Microbacterium sp. NPDC055683]
MSADQSSPSPDAGGYPPRPPLPPHTPPGDAPYAAQPPYGQQAPYGEQTPYSTPPSSSEGVVPGVQQSGAYVYPPTAPYAPQVDARYGTMLAAPQAAPASKAAGRVALLLSLLSLIGGAVVLAVCLFLVGVQSERSGFLETAAAEDPDWTLLAPVRDAVMTAEITWWVATALGIWALVQGIVAIARRRGRGAGIAAVVIAVLAPIVVGTIAFIGFAAGLAGGTGV